MLSEALYTLVILSDPERSEWESKDLRLFLTHRMEPVLHRLEGHGLAGPGFNPGRIRFLLLDTCRILPTCRLSGTDLGSFRNAVFVRVQV
jgi:hypothetical protein